MKKFFCFVCLFAFVGIMAHGRVIPSDATDLPLLCGADKHSSWSQFEYPIQTLEYNGGKVEARALISYNYDKNTDRYPYFVLYVFLKPLDADDFDADTQDSIAKYASYNSAIRCEMSYEKHRKQRIEGEAEVYVRSFGTTACKDADMAKLEYCAKFDPSDANYCRITYRLEKAEWGVADKTIEATPPQVNTRLFSFKSHGGNNYNRKSGSDGSWHNCYVEFDLNSVELPEEGKYDARGFKISSNTLCAWLFLTLTGDYTNGKIATNIVEPYPNNANSLNTYVMALGKKGTNEVTFQTALPVRSYKSPFFMERFPFMAKNKRVCIDVRAHVKYKNKKNKAVNEFPVVEQVVISNFFHH